MDKSVKAYVKLLLKKEIMSVKFLVLMLFMFCLCEAAYSGLPFYLAESGEIIGFWEMFASYLGSERTILFYFTGLIFLLGGLPYSGNDISLYVIRGNKRQWVKANIITIVISTIIYYIGIALIIMGMFIGRINFNNEWTDLFKNMQNSELGAKMGSWLAIFIDYGRIVEETPMMPCIITLLSAIFASIIIGLIIFLFSMYDKRRIGYIVCFLLIIGNLLTPELEGFRWYFYVQHINVVNYVKEMWLGTESGVGVTFASNCVIAIIYFAGLITWIFACIKRKDWVAEI